MLLIGATAAVVIVSQTSWFKNWVRGYIVREAGQYLNGTVSIDRLGGNLFFGLEMENVAVSMDGSEVVAVKDLGLDYSVFELISKGLSVDSIRLNKPAIYLRREGDTWSLSRLIKKQEREADRQGPARPIVDRRDRHYRRLDRRSTGRSGTSGSRGAEAVRSCRREAGVPGTRRSGTSIEITHVSFRGSDPELRLNALSGGVSVRNDTVYVDKLALRTAENSLSIDGAVQQYLTTPSLQPATQFGQALAAGDRASRAGAGGRRLQPAFELKLDGPLDRLNVDMNVRSSAGQVTGNVVGRREGARAVGHRQRFGHASRSRADPERSRAEERYHGGRQRRSARDVVFRRELAARHAIALNAPRIVAAGYAPSHVKAQSADRRPPLTVDGRAAAYGATATAAGSVVLPESKDGRGPIAFDLHGRASHVDLAKSTARPEHSRRRHERQRRDYHVAGSGSRQTVRGDLRFEPSTVAGAAIEGGSTLAFTSERERRSTTQPMRRSHGPRSSARRRGVQRAGARGRPLQERRSTAMCRERPGTTPAGPSNVTASGTFTDTSIMGGRIPQTERSMRPSAATRRT